MGPKRAEKGVEKRLEKRAKKRPEKWPRKEEEAPEENHSIARKGVAWRRNPTRCVVEMRPPQWREKLHFGSYGSKAEAMVARDYGAFLRTLAGESALYAGGFDARECKLYYFDEPPGVFKSMEETRRASVFWLSQQMDADCSLSQQVDADCSLSQQVDADCSLSQQMGADCSLSPRLQFCKDAREDIAVAIGRFHELYPHRFTSDGALSSSSSSVRVSPGSSPRVNLLVVMDGSPRRILVEIQAPFLDDKRISQIVTEGIRGVEAELNRAVEAELKWVEDLSPCTVDPLSIPAIEDPEW